LKFLVKSLAIFILICSVFMFCSKNSHDSANETDITNPIRGTWRGNFNLNADGKTIERVWEFKFTSDFKYTVTVEATYNDEPAEEYSFTESGIYVFMGSNREGKTIKLITADETVRFGSYTMGRRHLYLKILDWGEMTLSKIEG